MYQDYRYDFAIQWLDYLGVKVYNKGQQILKYNGKPNYEISPLGTKVEIGTQILEDEKQEYTYMPYPDLESMGYIVKRYSDSYHMWKPRQRYVYDLTRKRSGTVGMTQNSFVKAGLRIEHDAPHKRFRLIGENVLAAKGARMDAGVSEWIVYDKDLPMRKYKPSQELFTKEDLYNSAMFGNKNEGDVDYQVIKDIPVLISDEKYIVCIPRKDNECQRIIVAGSSGFGKSLSVNGLAGRIFYSGDRVSWLLDPLNQFYNISLPQDYPGFIKLNNLINEVPKPIPALQLYMACRYDVGIVHPNISLKIALNFEEFLRKYKFYTYLIKDFDVGDTVRYLPDWIDDIKKCTDAETISEAMFNKIPNAHKDKGMQAMIYKWKNTFETIFKEKFTSNLYKDDLNVTDELEIHVPDKEGNINKMKGHPFIMAMEAGLVPILNISSATKTRQRWLRNYLADLMQKIVMHQINAGENRKRIWIIADELNEIYEKGKSRDNATESFKELYRQGRYNNIGFIGNTQSLENLDIDMYKNANYIFCVYMKHKKERKRLEDFQVDKETYEQVGNLKSMEMMVFGSPGDPFIIYDRWGRRKVVTDRKWFKGKIIPPINHHNVPGGK